VVSAAHPDHHATPPRRPVPAPRGPAGTVRPCSRPDPWRRNGHVERSTRPPGRAVPSTTAARSFWPGGPTAYQTAARRAGFPTTAAGATRRPLTSSTIVLIPRSGPGDRVCGPGQAARATVCAPST